MVKCQDCGFLSLRKHATQELIEATEYTRQQGVLKPDGQCEMVPVCFVKAFNFSKESQPRSGADENNQERVRIFTTERDCNSWVEWQQGYTPKEHKEMLDQEALRKWQEDRRESDRKFEEEIRDGERKWQASVRTDDRKWQIKWQIIFISVAAVLGAVLGAVCTVIANWFGPSGK